MKNKKHLIKILFVLIIISSLVFIKEKTDLIGKLDNKVENFLSDNEIEKKEIKVIYENLSYDIQISFCPWQNCNKEFLYKINETKQEVKCAFYELSYEPLITLLIEKSKFVKVDLVIDKRYKDKLNFYNLENITILTNNNSIQMHNKFCVIDNQTLITGSMNPSENGFLKNNNNLLIINSKELSKNYLEEFENFQKGFFSKSKNEIEEKNFILNFQNETYILKNYFCPKNNCERKVLETLNKAEKEILFASFVLTNDNIELLLKEKAKQNLTIKGVIENRMRNTLGSKIFELNESFEIILDKNKNTMHHKFFIVDEKVLIVGSANPSDNGYFKNDENILIIENKNLAKKFKEEFSLLFI